MRVVENNASPTIITNVNGKILELQNLPHTTLGFLEIGSDVFELIDANALRKLSMYSSRIELIKTKSPKYPYAFARVRGKGNGKHIKIILIGEGVIVNSQITSIEQVLVSYTSQSKAKSNTCGGVLQVIEEILSKIEAERKTLVGAQIQLDAEKEIFVKLDVPSLYLLFGLTISILAEIGNNSLEISVCENGIVKLSAVTKEAIYINAMDGIVKKYPQLIAKAIMIEDICENEAVEVATMATINKVTIEYKMPLGNYGERYVKNDYAERADLLNQALLLIEMLKNK